MALGAPLPEGVFFVDLEDYGKRDGQANRLGVNVPITAWSTPFSFYNTRLEVLAAIPVFTHIDGPTLNRVDLYSQAILFAPRPRSSATASTPASSPARVARTTSPRPVAGAIADIRGSLSYVKDGFNATVTANYGGNLGGKTTQFNAFGQGVAGFDDNIFIDGTITKKFGKFEIGVVGYYQTDLNGPVREAAVRPPSVASSATISASSRWQAFATREIYVRNGGYGLGQPVNGVWVAAPASTTTYETRGYLRVIVPLYVAPAAPAPVVARY